MIHPTAVVDPSARLGEGVEVGAYSIIGARVEIGAQSRVGPHVVIQGTTRIGPENRIYQFASLGEAPQDRKYDGEETRLEIGARNVIREYCTINRGTVQDAGVTRLGDDNWIMAYAHIAHDCQVGSHTVFSNAASLAGHVQIEDHVVLGGFTLVHQFCRLGAYCFTAMGSGVVRDVPPFVTAAGHPAEPRGINSEGLKRAGFDAARRERLRQAYKVLYKQGLSLEGAKSALDPLAEVSEDVARLLGFLEGTRRGILR